MLQGVIDSIQQLTPYYLLFALESAPDGLFRSMKVDLKLPDTGLFSCTSNTDRTLIEESVRQKVKEAYPDLKANQFFDRVKVILAIEKGIETLAKSVDKAVNCCNPGVITTGCFECPDPDFVDLLKVFFDGNGFYKIPIEVQDTFQLLGYKEKDPEKSNPLVEDYSRNVDFNYSILALPNSEKIKPILEQLLSLAHFQGLGSNRKGIITVNESFCQESGNGTNDLLKSFKDSIAIRDAGVWVHIFDDKYSGGQDYLYIKTSSKRGPKRDQEFLDRVIKNVVDSTDNIYSYNSKFAQLSFISLFSITSLCDIQQSNRLQFIKENISNTFYSCSEPIVEINNGFHLNDPFLYNDRLYIYSPPVLFPQSATNKK